jgi:transposase-like protein
MLEGMIDFPLTDLMDAAACTAWLERHLHPDGLRCPRCGSPKRRFFRQFRHFVGYRCQACQRAYTILTGTIFAKSRQSPATIVMMIRGVAKGEPTAQLARELPVSRTTMHRIRQGMQDNVNETVPTAPMEGQTFEVDELYQNAGEKGEPHREPDDPPRRRANQQPGHGTYATDRPPIIHVRCRETGEVRTWVCDHADQETCRAIVRSAIPPEGTILNSDEWAGYLKAHPCHQTVCHSAGEWARDDDGDGVREVHCNTCEGMGAALRTFLRPLRGVHKAFLACYVAVFDMITMAKRITPAVVRRMCIPPPRLQRLHTSWT